MTAHLTLDDLLLLIDDLSVGPVTDPGLLDAAAYRPQSMLWGRDAYSGIDDKAAALLESIVRTPALADGNKRLGWLAVAVFYAINGTPLDAPDDGIRRLVVGVASGTIDCAASAATLRGWRA